MKRSSVLATFLAIAIAVPALSQVMHRRVQVTGAAADQTAPTDVQPMLADAVFLHGPGVRFEGPPRKGAPYSAEAVTETVQVLSDGNRIARESKAKVYRDNEGRTRREEKLGAVGPWAVAGEQPTRVFINDPVAGLHWILEPENEIARKMKMPKIEEHVGVLANVDVDVDVTVDVSEGAAPMKTRVEHQQIWVEHAEGGASPVREDLGTRMIEGVEAVGTRITRTIPAGEIGNERPIEVVFERWHSSELGVDVMTKRSDPRSADTTYKLTNIQRTEPLPSMFEPPADYEVKEPQGDVMIRRVEKRVEKQD